MSLVQTNFNITGSTAYNPFCQFSSYCMYPMIYPSLDAYLPYVPLELPQLQHPAELSYVQPFNFIQQQQYTTFPPIFNFTQLQQPALFNFNTNSSIQLYNNSINNYSNTYSSVRLSGNLGKDIVSTAKSYIGYNESNGSYKLFTGGRNEAWCADFSTYVVKEAYSKNGKKLPSGFGSSSVDGLRNWGQKNNCYLKTSGQSNKSSLIARNVKPGDIVIFKEGRSHTGIVTKVNADGSFETIEGNTNGNNVAYRKYSANEKTLSGFVQVA